jgi:hypothetical protein
LVAVLKISIEEKNLWSATNNLINPFIPRIFIRKAHKFGIADGRFAAQSESRPANPLNRQMPCR